MKTTAAPLPGSSPDEMFPVLTPEQQARVVAHGLLRTAERNYRRTEYTRNQVLRGRFRRGKVLQKMKADSLADLVKMAVRLGLTPARNPWNIAREPWVIFER